MLTISSKDGYTGWVSNILVTLLMILFHKIMSTFDPKRTKTSSSGIESFFLSLLSAIICYKQYGSIFKIFNPKFNLNLNLNLIIINLNPLPG